MCMCVCVCKHNHFNIRININGPPHDHKSIGILLSMHKNHFKLSNSNIIYHPFRSFSLFCSHYLSLSRSHCAHCVLHTARMYSFSILCINNQQQQKFEISYVIMEMCSVCNVENRQLSITTALHR